VAGGKVEVSAVEGGSSEALGGSEVVEGGLDVEREARKKWEATMTQLLFQKPDSHEMNAFGTTLPWMAFTRSALRRGITCGCRHTSIGRKMRG
jgi:hypothetical protein